MKPDVLRELNRLERASANLLAHPCFRDGSGWQCGVCRKRVAAIREAVERIAAARVAIEAEMVARP